MTDEPERDRTKRIDHTHPHTDQPFGLNGVYGRGPSESEGRVPPNEAETEATDRDGDSDRDVTDADRERDSDRGSRPRRAVQRVFDRGGEAGGRRGR